MRSIALYHFVLSLEHPFSVPSHPTRGHIRGCLTVVPYPVPLLRLCSVRQTNQCTSIYLSLLYMYVFECVTKDYTSSCYYYWSAGNLITANCFFHRVFLSEALHIYASNCCKIRATTTGNGAVNLHTQTRKQTRCLLLSRVSRS